MVKSYQLPQNIYFNNNEGNFWREKFNQVHRNKKFPISIFRLHTHSFFDKLTQITKKESLFRAITLCMIYVLTYLKGTCQYKLLSYFQLLYFIKTIIIYFTGIQKLPMTILISFHQDYYSTSNIKYVCTLQVETKYNHRKILCITTNVNKMLCVLYYK